MNIAKLTLLGISEYKPFDIYLTKIYKKVENGKIIFKMILSSKEFYKAILYLKIFEKYKLKTITNIETNGFQYIFYSIEIDKKFYNKEYFMLKNMSIFKCAEFLCKELKINHTILEL